MSTDYGLKCLDCQESIVKDNMRDWALDKLRGKDKLGALAAFYVAWVNVRELSIDVSAYWCNNELGSLLEFIAHHFEHRIVMVDEYGKEY